MRMNKFSGHDTIINEVSNPQKSEKTSANINIDYLEKVNTLLNNVNELQNDIEANYQLLEQQKKENATQMELLKKTANEIRSYRISEKIFENVDKRIKASVDNSLKDIFLKLKSVEDELGKIKSSITDSIIESADKAGDQVCNKVRQSWFDFHQTINKFKTWCNLWVWRLVCIMVWAILASGAFVWKCDSASYEQNEYQFKLDSLKLVNDFYSGFINSGKGIRKDFDDVWCKYKANEFLEKMDSLRTK